MRRGTPLWLGVGVLALFGTVQAQELPPLPQAKSSLGADVCAGWVYVYGGHTGKTHTYSTEDVTGRFHRLKLDGGAEWEQLPGGPAIQGLALVAHQGKLYRIGGMEPRNRPGEKSDNYSLAACARFDPATKKWEAIADLPEPRSSHDAVVVGDKIYVVGGWCINGAGGQNKWHDTVLVLDLSKQTLKWEALAQPFKRRALTAAASQGKIYVVGGLASERGERGGISIYDTKTGKWAEGPALPGENRFGGFAPASCALAGRVYLSPSDGKIYRLTEKGDGWEVMDVALKQARTVHRMVPVGTSRLVIVGGASRGGNLQATEVLELNKDKRTSSAAPTSKTVQQTHCPIMTEVAVGNDSEVVEYQGVKIQLCCETCVKKWKACPEAYLSVVQLPQLAGKKLPARPLVQVYCPVSKTRVVAPTDPFVMYQGVKVHLFSQAAVKRWQEAPEKYADAALLPQLKRGTP